MKIGKFAETNGLTIDTIRHYMDMGLVVPEKQGGQYSFDKSCEKDLEEVLSFKEMGFSLNEIKAIFMFKRLAQLTQYEENEYFLTLFLNKDRELKKQIEALSEMEEKLENKLNDFLQAKPREKAIMGIDIKALSLLQCSKCGNSLELSEGNIVKNQIINGKLKCICGEEYIIEDGILKVLNIKADYDIKSELNSIADYINATNTQYLDNLYRGMDWLHKKINFQDFKGKVILELGSGMGFFLRSIYSHISEDSIYIAVDHDISRHLLLKNILETADCRKNILFICSDFSNIPIKDKSADILIDIAGTSNYSFNNEEFLLKTADNYIKDNVAVIASYIMFENFISNSLIKDKYRKNFMQSNIKKQLAALKYNILEENVLSSIEKGGKYENYFKDGEKVYSYLIIGKR